MCEADNNRDWMSRLMPKITANLWKVFDDDQYEVSVPDDSLFLSSLFYVNIKPKNATAKKNNQAISIVIKKPPETQEARDKIKSDTQFHNEILFYTDYAEGSKEFPRCIYLEEKPPAESVIVLENVKERGYELCPSRYNVPLEYTLAAMQEIGRFHGRGYVMKERQREKFFDIVANIHESRYENVPNNPFEIFLNVVATRAIDYLREQGHEASFCSKVKKHFTNAYHNVMLPAVKPDEPLATLCHGDFTINNTLFQKQNGEIKAMLIDFALIRYGSPIVDLSTFICLHCPNELKKDKLENILRVYHDSLKGYFSECNFEDDGKYTYEAFYEDYKRRGPFGFIIASFYLSALMGRNILSVEETFKLEMEEAAKVCRESGGDEVSKILADMLLDLIDIGCLEDVL